jgi:hypothetical protein
MNQENLTQTETPEEMEELTNEELAELIDRAIKEGKEESKLIYVLRKERRYGGCGYIYLFEYGNYTVLLGQVEEIELDYENNENDCFAERTIALIPKSKEVIIHVENRDEDPQYRTCNELLVFKYPVGWKRLELCNDKIRLS